jgi:hypothetical protein
MTYRKEKTYYLAPELMLGTIREDLFGNIIRNKIRFLNHMEFDPHDSLVVKLLPQG